MAKGEHYNNWYKYRNGNSSFYIDFVHHVLGLRRTTKQLMYRPYWNIGLWGFLWITKKGKKSFLLPRLTIFLFFFFFFLVFHLFFLPFLSTYPWQLQIISEIIFLVNIQWLIIHGNQLTCADRGSNPRSFTQSSSALSARPLRNIFLAALNTKHMTF